MFLLILCFTNLIDCLLGTTFHISDIGLIYHSNIGYETNEIKGMKFHNSAQFSLDALTTDFERRTNHFIYAYFYSTTNKR